MKTTGAASATTSGRSCCPIPAFADGLRDATSRRPAGDRRWSLIAWALGAAVLLLVGPVAINPFALTLVGAVVAGVV